jgi:hypothetical protein
MSKRPLKYIIRIALFLIVCFIGLYTYDYFLGGKDELIKSIYFTRLFYRVFVLFGIAGILFLLKHSSNNVLKGTGFQLVLIGGFYFFLEFMSFLYFKIKPDKTFEPTHYTWLNNPPLGTNLEKSRPKFYGDLNPYFGKWRKPNAVFVDTRCSDNAQITYKSNSIGARDVERSKTGKSRIAMVGDSFIEGTLVNAENRLSNLLEQRTGVEHLNFGTINANPTAYAQTLKFLAMPNYEFDKIIIGILPANDFDTGKMKTNGGFYNYPIYRPFFDNDKIKYTLSNYKTSVESFEILNDLRILRATRDSIYSNASFLGKMLIEFQTNSYLNAAVMKFLYSKAKANGNIASYFEALPKQTEQLGEFSMAIKQIEETANERPILYVVFPLLSDIRKYKQSGSNKFTPYLRSLISKNNKSKVIDLLEDFSKAEKPESFYIPCDGHWNEKGNEYAARKLLENTVYQEFIQK